MGLAATGADPVLEVAEIARGGLAVLDGGAEQLERLGLEVGVEVGVLGDDPRGLLAVLGVTPPASGTPPPPASSTSTARRSARTMTQFYT